MVVRCRAGWQGRVGRGGKMEKVANAGRRRQARRPAGSAARAGIAVQAGRRAGGALPAATTAAAAGEATLAHLPSLRCTSFLVSTITALTTWPCSRPIRECCKVQSGHRARRQRQRLAGGRRRQAARRRNSRAPNCYIARHDSQRVCRAACPPQTRCGQPQQPAKHPALAACRTWLTLPLIAFFTEQVIMSPMEA